VNVLEELDYAVQIGVLATPAIAIDGELVFTALPSEKRLRQTLQQCIDHSSS
ncbi:Thioredoxin domain, partial [endosymbiont of Ridgeia piscesae]